ncbi:diaminopimelate epimerase [Clostridium aminobutyricum]|uniref:Diaminopimelate epimerase n=1 Tax=Clostridium aminobutyricum TaxID=33953 RepID=A0A939DBM7_CLOAM|nr:diaminopimelate epimerase [Clostridium aminobutyricum]MBN7774622.1 diaminopimelate epimerase [Clostridium aminobutyricum]
MMIKFAKYHGCGNDFIMVGEESVKGMDFSELALKVCHRSTGIGADGLIVVCTQPELEMIFYNQDGSRAPMCGNGIRCFAKYCFDYGICKEKEYDVKTLAGVMQVKVVKTGKETYPHLDPEKAEQGEFVVEIGMGKPLFDPATFGVNATSDFLNKAINTTFGKVNVSSCFMGTVHTVVLVDNLDAVNVDALGSEISNHPIYTEKTNVNFVEVMDKNTLKIKTYERGVGPTYACGTGACASLVIANLEGKCDDTVDVILPLGTLHITKTKEEEIRMAGPAVKIAEGVYYLGGQEQ